MRPGSSTDPQADSKMQEDVFHHVRRRVSPESNEQAELNVLQEPKFGYVPYADPVPSVLPTSAEDTGRRSAPTAAGAASSKMLA